MAPVLRQDQAAAFLRAAVAAVAPGSGFGAPVKIGACRAVALLSAKVPRELLQPLLPGLYGGLVQFLEETCEETQHLVLECLRAVVTVRGPRLLRRQGAAGPRGRTWRALPRLAPA
jgi:hypothetical protein